MIIDMIGAQKEYDEKADESVIPNQTKPQTPKPETGKMP
jgi:hypothetical protein